MTRSFILFLSLLMLPLLLSAQYVYTRAYRHQVTPLALEAIGNQLVTVGTVRGNAFGYTVMDTTGQLVRAVGYHNPRFDGEQFHFVHRYPGGDRILAGYGFIGDSLGLTLDSTHLVVVRVAPNGIPVWSRNYRWNNQLGGLVKGLVVGADSSIYLSAQMFQAGQLDPTIGLLAKLDGDGQILWTRQMGLTVPGSGIVLRQVKHNLTLNNQGDLLVGWNIASSPTAPVLKRGFTIRNYDAATGALNWEKQYPNHKLLTLNRTYVDNGLALYVEDTASQKILVRLNSVGEEIYSVIDAFQQNTDRATRIKTQTLTTRIPYLVGNRMTFWLSPFATSTPILRNTAAQQILSDFVTVGGHTFIAGYRLHPTTHSVTPFLSKAQVSPIVANCFLQYGTTNNFAPTLLDTMQIAPLPLTVQVLEADTLLLLRTALNPTNALQCVGNGLVWPGDANSNGIANVVDLLFLGLAWNQTGPARATQSIQWQGWPALDWNSQFFNGANKKHADANGNGHVGLTDLFAILLNYGLTHNKGGSNGTSDDPPFLLQIQNDSVVAGDTVHADIILGSSEKPLNDLSGIAFSIDYDPTIIDSASFVFTPYNSWLGTDSVDMISLQKDLPQEGVFHAALTRTDQTNAVGFGTIGKVTFVTIDDIAGKSTVAEKLNLTLSKMEAINVDQDEIDLFACSDSVIVFLEESTTGLAPEDLIAGVQVYPNPTTGTVYIRSQTVRTEKLYLLDLQGRMIQAHELNNHNAVLSLETLSKGVYLLKGHSENGIWMEKLIVQ